MRAIKHRTQSTIKHRENKHKVKQGFLIKECLLPLDICISPMNFSPYECAQGRITPPKNVHMSHKMTKYTDILSGIPSPFFVTNRQMNQEEGGKEKKIWTRTRCMRGARWMRKWNSTERQKNILKKNATKHKEHNMLRMMEHDINLGIT